LVWGGNQYPWLSEQIMSLFLIAIIGLLGFAFVENRAKEPIMPLSLFHNKIFSVSVLITFLTAMGMFGAILYIPLFAQGVLGVSATNSGFILTPLMVGMIAASAISGQIVSRTGKYKILAIIGTVLITGAMIFLSTIGTHTTSLGLMVRIIFLGIGLGITMPIFNIAVQNAFPQTHLGVVTAGTQLFRSIGGTVGTAVMGSVLNHGLVSGAKKIADDPFLQQMNKSNQSFSLDKFDANTAQSFLSQDVQSQIQTQLHHLPQMAQAQALQNFADFLSKIKGIMASSISEVFIIGSGLMAIAFFASFFLKEIPLRKSHKPLGEEIGEEFAMETGKSSYK
ncbi:MAG: MFS transporter, partial [Candidatus Levyibacteriota bacterium]